MKCGTGIYSWASGNFYKGEFFNDKRQGYGEMYWVNESFYKGMWHEGFQNGEGELVFIYEKYCIQYIKNEGLRKGVFRNNILINLYIYEEESQ